MTSNKNTIPQLTDAIRIPSTTARNLTESIKSSNRAYVNQLFALRLKAGMSRREVALAMGASEKYVHSLEESEDRLKIKDLIQYADAIGYKVSIEFTKRMVNSDKTKSLSHLLAEKVTHPEKSSDKLRDAKTNKMKRRLLKGATDCMICYSKGRKYELDLIINEKRELHPPYVVCKTCGSEGDLGNSPADAIEKWNRVNIL